MELLQKFKVQLHCPAFAGSERAGNIDTYEVSLKERFVRKSELQEKKLYVLEHEVRSLQVLGVRMED